MSSTTLSPIRGKAKGLLHRFLNKIERDCDRLEGDIPDLTNAQWRTVSAVLATYRMLVDEHFQELESEQARLDYSKLSIEELQLIAIRFKDHPGLAGTNGGDPIIQIPDNGGTP